YHFARPDNNTALEDADNFINQTHNYLGNGYLPPVLDFEDPNSSTHLDQLYSSQHLTNWVQTWLNRVETQTGVKPILYLNAHYANFLQSSLNGYGLWIAKPNTSPTTPPGDIGHWNDWMFKQYSWYGSVNGISGNVDLNVFNGSISDFNNMISTNNVQILNPTSIKVYPNPTNSILHIINKNKIDIKQMSMYDINGRLILNSDGFKKTLDLQNLDKGFYVLKIKFNNGQTQKIKVLKN
ncbi:MAG TPA: T9SS type A sorting domain-containing protein, partial [Flavobacteriales bacterium]|nr:T9SS type A sorting domain-containing protein [Flavobacteriales bacterium]